MLKLAIAATMSCALAISDAALADSSSSSTPPAAPTSPIATFDGENFCIYSNQLYSVGAVFCFGTQALECARGYFPHEQGPKSFPSAAKWGPLDAANAANAAKFCPPPQPPAPAPTPQCCCCAAPSK
jgi:Protein of unknown function (DUF1496)